MIYFGNKGAMQWVKAPSVDFDSSRVGWSSQVQFLNGGAGIRKSNASHAEATLTWGLMSSEEARKILRPLRSGELVYWVDPFVENHAPQAWAEPWRAGYDGPILDNSDVRPTLFPEAAVNGYPTQSAQYSLTAATVGLRKSTYIPIPPGYSLRLGATGANVSGTARLRVTPDAGAASDMTFTAPTSTNPYSKIVVGGVNGNGVTLSLTGTGSIRLRSIMAHLSPTGSPSPSGGFVEGEGMGGSLPASEPSESRYSAVVGHANRTVSTRLVEVASWQ